MSSKPAKNPFTREKLESTVISSIIIEVIIFTGLAAIITSVSKLYYNLGVGSQMLTVLGTVVGLVISFRTSSAYERYWEGRKLWSSFHTSCRNLAEVIWIHVPLEKKIPIDNSCQCRCGSDKDKPESDLPAEDPQYRLKSIIEKKTMINVIEAMGPAVKHYLRDEPGILYEDLYPLLSGLPHFASPDPGYQNDNHISPLLHYDNWAAKNQDEVEPRLQLRNHAGPTVPLTDNVTSRRPTSEPGSFDTQVDEKDRIREIVNPALHVKEPVSLEPDLEKDPSVLFHGHMARPDQLKKAQLPPPFRLSGKYRTVLVIASCHTHACTKRVINGKERREQERLARESKEKKPKDNIPLELCLFLSSYYAVLMERESLQGAICTAFFNNLSTLQDCMLNLERIKITPIPFAYQAHLRMATWLYLFLLPFQLYTSLDWITIPATAAASFILRLFTEDPFGYDLNDLNLDKFCKGISRELIQITAHQKMDPRKFVFSEWNRPLEPALGKGVTAPAILRDEAYNVARCEHVARGVLLSGHRRESLVDDSKKARS
ncbi:hypothetical protein BOTBODRAFT_193047 [Botryobasidium botryosum FD-172 SS1]|uniref:Bestrophin homolog n=1 Tax=Botryobasidium botryosum (strain FD-172 SS1) TaxID=930990 RepID=A0A067M3H5_BOTB1|nr:hypothetical protein BOTBODRAFT_193047 [Botryobasidium botryosum FD-172 SS1]